MAYKMKGSPATMGTIQGTSGHTSALKQSEEELKAKHKEVLGLKYDAAIAEGAEAAGERKKKAAKEITKEKVRAYKQSSGKEKGGLYDVSTDEFQALDKDAQDWITKKNRKVQAKMDETKTETGFDFADALKSFLSSGGGKEGLFKGIGAGITKKSPNELLAADKARKARLKKNLEGM